MIKIQKNQMINNNKVKKLFLLNKPQKMKIIIIKMKKKIKKMNLLFRIMFRKAF